MAEGAPDPRQSGSSILDQYRLLATTGALDDLAALRKENRELDLILNDAAALFARDSVEGMLSFVISRLLDRFIPARLAFLIEPPRGGELIQYCYSNLKPAEPDFPLGSYPAIKGHFLGAPYPISFEDLELELGKEPFDWDFRSREPRMLFPLLGIGGLYGVAVLGRKVLGDEYDELERLYLDRMTRFLSIGIQNSLHHANSITDAKTGLYNNQHFTQRVEEELARGSRHGSAVGVIMLDVDHFKRFNDRWGHLAGDEVLIALAATIKRTIRAEDVAARFGGEEFSVLLTDCDEPGVLDAAERVRAGIEAMAVPFEGELLRVTASLGCCLVAPGEPGPANRFLERADRALYRSKRSGRNRSSLWKASLLERASSLRDEPVQNHGAGIQS
jgi:diguanylate cyclase (GGDEF)-like protein